MREMLSPEQVQVAQPSIRTSQVIAAAIMMGAIMFGVVLSTFVVDWEELGGPVKLMSTLAAGSTIIFFGLAIVIPGMFPTLPNKIAFSEEEAVQNRAVAEIGKLLTSQNIVRFALLEACIFVNLLPLMFEPRWISIIAAGVGVLLMLLLFPWPGLQLRKIEERFHQWKSGVMG